MTAAEYIDLIRTAETNEAAAEVTRAAFADAQSRRLTVDEWNDIWAACDKRCRPWRYRDNNWTGD